MSQWLYIRLPETAGSSTVIGSKITEKNISARRDNKTVIGWSLVYKTEKVRQRNGRNILAQKIDRSIDRFLCVFLSRSFDEGVRCVHATHTLTIRDKTQRSYKNGCTGIRDFGTPCCSIGTRTDSTSVVRMKPLASVNSFICQNKFEYRRCRVAVI